MQYRRAKIGGGTYFFTVNLAERNRGLLVDHIDHLRNAIRLIRYFTVFEAKRIQTFPDDFIIEGAWGEAMRQIGNAVPVKLAEIIGWRLEETLGISANFKQKPRACQAT